MRDGEVLIGKMQVCCSGICIKNISVFLANIGTFLLGFAAIITLPQAPEMLKKILKIETGVHELKTSNKKLEDAVEEIKSGNKDLRKSSSEIRIILERIEKGTIALGSKEGAMKIKKDPKNVDTVINDFKEYRGMPSGTVYLPTDKIGSVKKALKETSNKEEIERVLQENLKVRW